MNNLIEAIMSAVAKRKQQVPQPELDPLSQAVVDKSSTLSAIEQAKKEREALMKELGL